TGAQGLAEGCGVVLALGSPNSSNSNRWRQIAAGQGGSAYLSDGPEDIRPEWVSNLKFVGITAGASAPEVLVQQVIARLKSWGAVSVVENPGKREEITFAVPNELR
ncbi:MAG: 4-hydroxy-3-methylbut-2-enyl diphosphate reductase, partial [Gammaproteobacteria bacterium]|nr:4-hydroxy-3-methylbut-2-enyl diphosphate reductase [Gammaproteobacteria bacterium]